MILSVCVCVCVMQVFRPRTPPEAIALCSRLLEYPPSSRFSPLEACAHSFFDELREPNTKLPNGRDRPPLFNFTTQGRRSLPPAHRSLHPGPRSEDAVFEFVCLSLF